MQTAAAALDDVPLKARLRAARNVIREEPDLDLEERLEVLAVALWPGATATLGSVIAHD